MTQVRTGSRSRVTAADRAVLVAMAMAGATQDQMAERLGISVSSVKRRLAEPLTRRALAEAEADVTQRVARSIQTAATHGLRVLLEAATSRDVPWPSRVAAAGKIVTLAVAQHADAADNSAAFEAELDAAALTLESKMATLEARLIDAESREMPAVVALPAPARAS